jgi:hypothetical protein
VSTPSLPSKPIRLSALDALRSFLAPRHGVALWPFSFEQKIQKYNFKYASWPWPAVKNLACQPCTTLRPTGFGESDHAIVVSHLPSREARVRAWEGSSPPAAVRTGEVGPKRHRASPSPAAPLLEDVICESREKRERGAISLEEEERGARWSLKCMDPYVIA